MADATKDQLLAWIDADKDKLVRFLGDFIRAKSPNPPGNTLEAAAHVTRFLEAERLAYRKVVAEPTMPNIVAAFDAPKPGKHLVLNGHIDVFAVADESKWTHGAWSGAVVDGKIYGRGSADMKAGTTASIWTYAYLHRIKEKLKGKLTLTVVSDEETFGPYGANYLMANHPEVHGDCCLNGEPSSIDTLRFGEKGLLWLRFIIETPGSHGAYPHRSASASKIAAKLIDDLEGLSALSVELPGNVAGALKDARAEMERALGAGASDIVPRVTVNIGLLQAGIKVNMTPSQAVMEVDIRMPVGMTRERVLAEVAKILARHPLVRMEEINHNAPNWSDPGHPMVEIIQANCRALGVPPPKPVVSLGCTDARLWRYRNVPAFVYGPAPAGMGGADEHVPVDVFLHVVRTHVLSAYDYMMR
ncbi:MAG: M20/M25/M40 family metallo-hydrolase [Alphaproteobacteria bacterium]|nr:M20/M25/M40 family metallo-hydrolase [Alphaproteobacteria bacterium]